MKPQVLGMGQIYDITCEKQFIPEFPDLLFGEQLNGSNYFDATIYLKKNPDQNKSVEDFFKQFDFQIKALAEHYNVPPKNQVIINSAGHQLVVGCFCFLFLSYVNIPFNAYIFERIDELFSQGIAMSDSYLAETIHQRFTPDIVQQIFKDEQAKV